MLEKQERILHKKKNITERTERFVVSTSSKKKTETYIKHKN